MPTSGTLLETRFSMLTVATGAGASLSPEFHGPDLAGRRSPRVQSSSDLAMSKIPVASGVQERQPSAADLAPRDHPAVQRESARSHRRCQRASRSLVLSATHSAPCHRMTRQEMDEDDAMQTADDPLPWLADSDDDSDEYTTSSSPLHVRRHTGLGKLARHDPRALRTRRVHSATVKRETKRQGDSELRPIDADARVAKTLSAPKQRPCSNGLNLRRASRATALSRELPSRARPRAP